MRRLKLIVEVMWNGFCKMDQTSLYTSTVEVHEWRKLRNLLYVHYLHSAGGIPFPKASSYQMEFPYIHLQSNP